MFSIEAQICKPENNLFFKLYFFCLANWQIFYISLMDQNLLRTLKFFQTSKGQIQRSRSSQKMSKILKSQSVYEFLSQSLILGFWPKFHFLDNFYLAKVSFLKLLLKFSYFFKSFK